MSALEDRIVGIVADAPDGVRFAEVLVRVPDHVLPVEVFEALRHLTVKGRLTASGMGNVDRPLTARYRLRSTT